MLYADAAARAPSPCRPITPLESPDSPRLKRSTHAGVAKRYPACTIHSRCCARTHPWPTWKRALSQATFGAPPLHSMTRNVPEAAAAAAAAAATETAAAAAAAAGASCTAGCVRGRRMERPKRSSSVGGPAALIHMRMSQFSCLNSHASFAFLYCSRFSSSYFEVLCLAIRRSCPQA